MIDRRSLQEATEFVGMLIKMIRAASPKRIGGVTVPMTLRSSGGLPDRRAVLTKRACVF
jgi:hypothetical protein